MEKTWGERMKIFLRLYSINQELRTEHFVEVSIAFLSIHTEAVNFAYVIEILFDFNE